MGILNKYIWWIAAVIRSVDLAEISIIRSIQETNHTYEFNLGQNAATEKNHPHMWYLCIIATVIVLRQKQRTNVYDKFGIKLLG